MTKDEDFKLLKIQTCGLRVNIHCDGCKQKVRKLLQRIEGVFQVNIDADLQKVTVSGSVDSATLIKKLVRAGKHAELWSNKNTNLNQKQNTSCVKDDKNSKAQKQNLIKGLEALKNQQKFQNLILDEDDDSLDDDDDDDDEDDDEVRFLREKAANQLNLLRQQAKVAGGAAAAASNNGKMNNNSGNANVGKKGNPHQNMGMKANHGGLNGIDAKTMAALKLNNAHLGGGNTNPGELKRGGNDTSAMMGLAGYHGNGANNNIAAALGGNPNAMGGFQFQPNNGNIQAPGSSSTGLPNGVYATGHHHPSSMMMDMNGYQQFNNNPSAMMMNLQNRYAMQQQPQMMYNRSALIPPSTGYFYHNYPVAYGYNEPSYVGGDHSSAAAAHMFSDENTSSCAIM